MTETWPRFASANDEDEGGAAADPLTFESIVAGWTPVAEAAKASMLAVPVPVEKVPVDGKWSVIEETESTDSRVNVEPAADE
jgi:hypothetical protein